MWGTKTWRLVNVITWLKGIFQSDMTFVKLWPGKADLSYTYTEASIPATGGIYPAFSHHRFCVGCSCKVILIYTFFLLQPGAKQTLTITTVLLNHHVTKCDLSWNLSVLQFQSAASNYYRYYSLSLKKHYTTLRYVILYIFHRSTLKLTFSRSLC